MSTTQKKKIALVHDYFFQYGGAEKVVEVWLEMYPDSILHTAFYYPPKFEVSKTLNNAWKEGRIKITWLQGLLANKLMISYAKHFFWLYPLVMSMWTLRGFDTVIMTSSYCAKNVRFSGTPRIIHYCLSPTRFLHNMDLKKDLGSVSSLLRSVLPLFTFWLKWLDVRAAHYLIHKGAHWAALATHMQIMLKQVYGAECTLLYPPTEVDHFLTLKKVVPKDQFYYYFGRVSFHKKIDIIIHACARLQKRLLISGGAGLQSEFDSLNNLIMSYDKTYPGTSERITLLGRSTDEERDMLLSQCTAFLFAGKEDYGISPIEAMASGTPIIMYQAGGALDYLKPGVNGVFAKDQTPESFMDAMTYLESHPLKEKEIRHSTLHLTRQRFERGIRKLVEG